MTGAGSATVAFAMEDEFLDLEASPTYYQPGKNVQVQDLSIQNALERVRDPGEAMPVDSIAQTFEGALSVSFDLAGDAWHDLVFPDSGTSFPSGAYYAPSAHWFIGLDYLDGTAERVTQGTAVVDAQVQWQSGATVRVDLTMIYGDEEFNASITPANIETPPAGDLYAFHGADLELDATVQAGLQQATLNLSNLARFRRGGDRFPMDVVGGAVEPTLDVEAIFTEESVDNVELAYGSSGASSPQDTVDSVPAQLALENGAGGSITYDLGSLKHDTYGWDNLVNPDEDTTESITFHVNESVEVV